MSVVSLIVLIYNVEQFLLCLLIVFLRKLSRIGH